MAKSFKNHYPIGILFIILMLIELNSARQTRINRYTTEVEEDKNLVIPENVKKSSATATAPAPYPAAGYRPRKAFLLPNEENEKEISNENFDSDDQFAETTTVTDLPEAYLSTTIQNADEEAVTGPYLPAGFQPNRQFNLPSNDEISVEQTVSDGNALGEPAQLESFKKRTPYPAAGIRPARVFNYPNEAPINPSTTEATANTITPEPHPACGVRDDKMPKMSEDRSQDDPDSERVVIPQKMHPISYNPFLRFQSQPIITQQPIFLANRPFAYSAQVQTW